MKKVLFIVLILISVSGYSQYYSWVNAIAGSMNETGTSVQMDASGNKYVIGYFEGTVDFDPGAGTTTLMAAGSSNDIFIAKYNNIGALVWVNGIGDTGDDQAYNLQINSNGDLFVTGVFEGTVDFDGGPGTTTVTSAGSQDIFIAKYSNSGSCIWAKAMGGINADYGSALQIDASDNVYCTGYFQGEADFNPGPATNTLNAFSLLYAYVAKYDNNGNYVWAFAIDGGGNSLGKSIQLDASGNVYVAGDFLGGPDFNPSVSSNTILSNGIYDVFFAKYDNSGNYIMAKGFGGATEDLVHSMKLDATGKIYLTGEFKGNVDFNPGAGTNTINALGGLDIFIASFDNSGAYLWANGIGGMGDESGKSIQADAAGNLYVTGYFQNAVDFDPGAGDQTLNSAGVNDIFMAKYSSTGTYSWAVSMGGTGEDMGNAIYADAAGNTCLTGVFSNTVDFDPGLNTTNITAIGGKDVFLAGYAAVLINVGLNELKENNMMLYSYPNPFTQESTLTFELLSEATVTIKIFNSIGKEIKLIENNRLNKGNYQYQIDVNEPGVYFVNSVINDVNSNFKIIKTE